MGYAGLRFDEKGLLFNPTPGFLTPATNNIRLRNLLVQGTYPFDYTIDQTSMSFITADAYTNLLCITDQHDNQWKITNNVLKLSFQTVSLPIRIDLCNKN